MGGKLKFLAFFLAFSVLATPLLNPIVVSANTNTWDFTDPANYTFNSTQIEISSGKASLKTQVDWYDSQWTKRRTITITNPNTSTLTNYQVKITVPYDTSMRSDFGDIRFTNSSGTLLSYWLEKRINSTSATFWVEVSSIPASSSTAVYMYYGNASVTTTSDGKDTFLFFDSFSGVATTSQAGKFVYESTTNKNVHAHQGVGYDGTYFYTTGIDSQGDYTLYKWDSSWNLVASRSVEGDDPTGKTQVNHIFYKDGKLYLGANNYNISPRHGWILVYDASDLSYITYHSLLDHGNEGATFHNGYWWAVYGNYKYVSKYDTSWNWVADYALSYPIDDHYYQGIIWVEDYIYVNIHDGTTPNRVDVYHWNGSGFDEVARLAPPTAQSTQGLALGPDGKTVWFAERAHLGVVGDNRVVESTLVRAPETFLDVDSTTWTEENDPSFTIHDGALRAVSGGYQNYNMTTSFTPTTSVWVEWRQRTAKPGTAQFVGGLRDANGYNQIGIMGNDFRGAGGNGWKTFGENAVVPGTWYIIGQQVTPGSTSVTWKAGEYTLDTTISSSNFNQLYFRLYSSGAGSQYIDWIRVRKSEGSEPAVDIASENSVFGTTNPSMAPDSPQSFTSLSGFTETATKNGGQIKYQISNDGGSTWYWWTGSSWVTTSSGYAEATTASQIDANISTFPVGSGQFLFKAYLHSDGTQQVQLDSVDLTFANVTDEQAPTVDDFAIDSASNDLTVAVTSFIASDNSGSIAGYMVTESSSQPSAGDSGWQTTAPTSYSFTAEGSKTLYAWVKDAAGNISTSASDTVTITLPNDAPTVSITAPSSGSTYNEDESFTIEAAASDEDGSISQVEFFVAGNSIAVDSTAPYQTSASVTAPQNNVTIKAVATDDDSTTASDMMTVDIVGVNEASTISSIGNMSTDEDSSKVVDFTVTDTNLSGVSVTATAVDASLITVGVTDNGSGSYILEITPKANQNGSTQITITADDGANSVDEQFTLTVNPVNDAPVLALSVSSKNISEDGSGTVSFTASDIDDGASITLSASSDNTTLIDASHISITGTYPNYTLSLTPNANQSGDATITITADDGTNTTHAMLALHVGGSNDSPTISNISDQTIDEDTSLTDLSFTIGDTETSEGSLTLSATTNNTALIDNSGITFGVSGMSRTISLSLTPDGHGSAVITVTVTDTDGGTVSEGFSLTVNSQNDSPVANPKTVQTSTSTVVTIDVLTNDTDIDGDNLSIKSGSVTQPTHGTTTFIGDGDIKYIPTDGFIGTDSFEYTVQDGNGGEDTTTVTVNIEATTDTSDSSGGGGVLNPINEAMYGTTSTDDGGGDSVDTDANQEDNDDKEDLFTLASFDPDDIENMSEEEKESLVQELREVVIALVQQVEEIVSGGEEQNTDESNTPLMNHSSTPCPYYNFTHDLEYGDRGRDVRGLQIFLNCSGFILAPVGPGSQGHETFFFGMRTEDAVTRFQNAYESRILAPIGLTSPTGYFGDRSSEMVEELMLEQRN